jgi:hypothetical protein
MCNLCSITTNQAAIAALFRVVNRYVGNLAPMPGELPLSLPKYPLITDIIRAVRLVRKVPNSEVGRLRALLQNGGSCDLRGMSY